MSGQKIALMPRLREQFVHLLAQQDVDNPNYRTEKMKRHLRKRFSESLVFWQTKKRSSPCVVHAVNLEPTKTAALLSIEDRQSCNEPLEGDSTLLSQKEYSLEDGESKKVGVSYTKCSE